ncbi:hypothetical protein D3C85_1164040 [compost metagenome]
MSTPVTTLMSAAVTPDASRAARKYSIRGANTWRRSPWQADAYPLPVLADPSAPYCSAKMMRSVAGQYLRSDSLWHPIHLPDGFAQTMWFSWRKCRRIITSMSALIRELQKRYIEPFGLSRRCNSTTTCSSQAR